MAWPEDALTEDEEIVTHFRPHWKLLLVPGGWLILLLFLLGVVLVWVPGSGMVDLLLVAALLAAAAVLVLRPLVNWWFTRYVLTTERLITRRGLVARWGIEIPLERVTNVNFSQTVLERLLGAGDLLVESAGEEGRSMFSNIPRPDRFQALLYKVRERRTLELAGSGSAAPRSDPAERLRRLAELRRDGLISDAEYERKRRELLEEM